MYFVLYLSSATKPMDDHELFELLEELREKNKKKGITGMLLYKGGNYMQFLEGEERVLKPLLERIKRDPRHKDITLLMEDETEQRVFKSWSMGFVNMDKKGEYPSYNEYIAEHLNLQHFTEDAEDAYDFICTFNEYNT